MASSPSHTHWHCYCYWHCHSLAQARSIQARHSAVVAAEPMLCATGTTTGTGTACITIHRLTPREQGNLPRLQSSSGRSCVSELRSFAVMDGWMDRWRSGVATVPWFGVIVVVDSEVWLRAVVSGWCHTRQLAPLWCGFRNVRGVSDWSGCGAVGGVD